MGWGLRIFAFLVGLALLGLGLWPVALLAFAYLFLSFRKPREKEVYVLKQQPAKGFGQQRARRPWGRYMAGFLILLIAAVALRSGGTFSPVVIGAVGIVVLFWPSIGTTGRVRGVRPVEDSVLLRYRSFPFAWCALAEVKLESENPTRAVSSLEGEVLLFAGKTPSVFLKVRSFAPSYGMAEKSVLAKLASMSKRLSPRGGYLLPLDSKQVAAKLSVHLERVDLYPGDIEAASTFPFDVFVMRVDKARVVSHGAFRVADDASVSPSVPRPNLRPERQPLFWELAEMIGERHGWPGPDKYTSFLSALHASRGEGLGERLTGGGQSEGMSMVQSLGGTTVELTKPQLRALAEIYA